MVRENHLSQNNENKKRQREEQSQTLPKCLSGQTPTENFKRRIIGMYFKQANEFFPSLIN